MIVVISKPDFYIGETGCVTRLFEAGLERFHLRKPAAEAQQLRRWVEAIPKQFHCRIVWHQGQQMAAEMGFRNWHLNEKVRRTWPPEEITRFYQSGIRLSTSLHEAIGWQALGNCFTYCFLSPVFDSISKPGYRGRKFDLSERQKERRPLLFALGGIHSGNCRQAGELGFDGIALCGSVWETADPISSFNTIQKLWNTTDR